MSYAARARALSAADADGAATKCTNHAEGEAVNAVRMTNCTKPSVGAGEANPLAAIAQRERWDLEATVAAILALPPEKLATYRAALAFDTEALKRADAMLAAVDGRPDSAGRKNP